MDEWLAQQHFSDGGEDCSGSTGVVGVLNGSKGYIANTGKGMLDFLWLFELICVIGDSRAILLDGSTTRDLSEDHKPSLVSTYRQNVC